MDASHFWGGNGHKLLENIRNIVQYNFKISRKTVEKTLSAYSRLPWNGGRGRMMIEPVILLTRNKTHYCKKEKKKRFELNSGALCRAQIKTSAPEAVE